MVCQKAGGRGRFQKGEEDCGGCTGHRGVGLRVRERMRRLGDGIESFQQFRDAESHTNAASTAFRQPGEREFPERDGWDDKLADCQRAEQREGERDDFECQRDGRWIWDVRAHPAIGCCGGPEQHVQRNVYSDGQRECERLDCVEQQRGKFSADDSGKRNGDCGEPVVGNESGQFEFRKCDGGEQQFAGGDAHERWKRKCHHIGCVGGRCGIQCERDWAEHGIGDGTNGRPEYDLRPGGGWKRERDHHGNERCEQWVDAFGFREWGAGEFAFRGADVGREYFPSGGIFRISAAWSGWKLCQTEQCAGSANAVCRQ